MRTKRRKKVKKSSWSDEYTIRKRRLSKKLFELKDELNRRGYHVQITSDWDTYIITPKMDARFLRVMKDNDFTIETKPFGNMAQNTLLLQDMRKKAIKMPINKDFNIKLAIKLVDDNWDDSSSIRYVDNWYKGKEIDEEDDD